MSSKTPEAKSSLEGSPSVSSSSDSSLSSKPKGAKGTAILNKNPVQVARRNARERNRVRQVNQGFIKLRDTIPNPAKSKKLSKVDTLRAAAAYIKYLHTVLTVPGDAVKPFNSSSENHHSLPPLMMAQGIQQAMFSGSCGQDPLAQFESYNCGQFNSPSSGFLASPSDFYHQTPLHHISGSDSTATTLSDASVSQNCSPAMNNNQNYFSTAASGQFISAAYPSQHALHSNNNNNNAYAFEQQCGFFSQYSTPAPFQHSDIKSPDSDNSPTPSCLSETSFDYSESPDVKPFVDYLAY